jgi:hypothetical protein
MEIVSRENSKITNNSNVIYVHDEKLGWINVTLFLENLKNILNTMESTRTNNSFDLIL